MTVTIEIAPDIEVGLQEQAACSGVTVPDYIQRLVENSVRGPRQRGAAILAALDTFMEQDEQDHRDTLATLRQSLDADRPGQRRVFGEGTNPRVSVS